MIATRLRAILLLTVAQLVPCSAATLLQAARANSPQSTNSPRVQDKSQLLTQEDVDYLLRQSRASIQQGDLVKAESMLKRAESANLRFSRFHIGPTPDSVRRELMRAQQGTNSAAGSQTKSPSRFLPFSRNGNAQTQPATDPFLSRSSADKKQAAGPLPRPQVTLPNTAQQVNQQPGTDRPLPSLPSLGKAVDNPFVAKNSAAPNRQNGAAEPAAPSGQPKPLDAYAQLRTSGSSALPDAPMPAATIGQGSRDAQPQGKSAGLMPLRPAPRQPNVENKTDVTAPKQQAKQQLAAARHALDGGDIDLAEKLSRAATSLGVSESEFLPDEDRPSLVAWDVIQARHEKAAPQTPAAAASQASAPAAPQASTRVTPRYPTTAAPSAYSRNPASRAQIANPAAMSAPLDGQLAVNGFENESIRMTDAEVVTDQEFSQPVDAQPAKLPPQQVAEALPPADVAAPSQSQTAPLRALAPPPDAEDLPLPGSTAKTPVETSSESAEPAAVETPAKASAPKSLLDSAEEAEQTAARQLSAEIGKRQSEALRLQTEDPKHTVATLREAQQLVNDSKLPESARRELLSRIEITLTKTEKYIKDHTSEIELDKQNEAVLADRDRDREMKLKVQQKTADLVDEFNRLRDEQRYAEMEIIARRLIELAPDDPLSIQIWQTAKFIRREMLNRQVADDKESAMWEQLHSVDEASVNPVAKDGQELVFPKQWGELVDNRVGSGQRVQRRTERELEIERRLKTPVLLKYQDTPLSEVADSLSELTGVNIHLDPRSLSQEGYNGETPVTINLSKEISLKSALNLILEPLHLTYVINDEVLKITSEQLRDGEIYPVTYNVADLVTPIPNFVPSNNIGLQGLINEAQASASHGQMGVGNSGPTMLVNNRGQQPNGTGANDQVLAQQFNAAPAAGGMSPSTVPIRTGPGGMGAGANADFDSLIDLIVSTVSTETWAENGGGEAEIRPFPTNLSLVVSQTQAVHEEIADLLEQLRRLQDLQVTIEVRFIRLNERFFERIGIDFDMNVEDKIFSTDEITHEFDSDGVLIREPPGARSATVGTQRSATGGLPDFTSDLDIPFRQGSFAAALPPAFGGFDPNSAATFGFAILSDLEAYFLIEAAQGDQRTNVLNAPKVTLFNGQQAFVADATQRPFVVGVIPVVGEFAAAQQPVIVVLNEGTMMTIQAVVSDDRRYVRMTIVPFFTQIGDVDTFTFEGSTSTTSSSSSADSDEDGKNEEESDDDEVVRSGVTVQLPSFSFISVVTTVSVPDGGTVLLGGIKRLNEGRNEFGVPLLSKVPYINRLFRNVGIGRSTDSLMMMVTPRIIIQEEEEERLGIAIPGG